MKKRSVQWKGKVDLKAIEIYHDKFNEVKSGGVARKIGFLREEEIAYERDGGGPSSGLLVRWTYPVERRTRLDKIKIFKK